MSTGVMLRSCQCFLAEVEIIAETGTGWLNIMKGLSRCAPDLRGHGDSQWMIGGAYNQIDYVYEKGTVNTFKRKWKTS